MGKFDDLSDLDFEEIVADILSAEFGLRFRAGTRGRDAGIDILALDPDGAMHVIQCKHYRDSAFPALRRAAQQEAAKLKATESEFASYRFVTSRRLNHEQRAILAHELADWISSPEDILGENDLSALLLRHPEVEKRHVKLWLASAAPLHRMLNAAAYRRSGAMVLEARRGLPRYLETKAYVEARDILRRERVCVITGPPGVGKTTLARLLMLDGLEEGFQPYQVSLGNVRDAWQLLETFDERQLFYFDDFLGQTELSDSRDEDAQVLQLMRHIANLPGRRLVLTTREYILRRAKHVSETLDRDTDEAHQFLLTLDGYNRQEKARIFYNHMFFSSEVDEVAISSLLEDRGYLKIIDHRSYNPRLIEWVTGWAGHAPTDEEKRDYTSYCLAVLNNPKQLWTHAFERGLGDSERALLIALLGLPRWAKIGDVEEAFEAGCLKRGISLSGRQFVRSLEVLDDSFVRIDGSHRPEYVSFLDPSLIDFIRRYLRGSTGDASAAIGGVRFFCQVRSLWGVLREDSGAPPSQFATLFGEAITRTIDSPEPGGRDSFQLHGPRSEVAWQQRLSDASGFVRRLPALSEWVDGWRPHVDRWLEQVASGEAPVNALTPKLLGELDQIGSVKIDESIPILKTCAEKLAIGPDRFMILDNMRDVVSSCFSDAEWESHGDDFVAYMEDIAEDPWEHLSSEDDVDRLELCCDGFGFYQDDFEFGEIRERWLEQEREGRGLEFDPGDYREDEDVQADFGEEDSEIADLFDRLKDRGGIDERRTEG